MSATEHRIADLEHAVATLRAELAALRDGLADEIRTRRIVVADGEQHVEIAPGWLIVDHPVSGHHVTLRACDDHAEVCLWSGDLVGADSRDMVACSIGAGIDDRDAGEPARRAYVDVDGVDLAVPQPTG
jgi:hypothetical protein